ncbi:MAG TPA: glycosyltransferase family 2 protein, partial [Anaerolineales bacterium]|nr:glycosyltransferase family 2 protein [Anaerolineales bacterium]
MNSLPSISIVTPSLNQRHFIEATINSVLHQAYPKLEHIVIDGGSTDGTQELLPTYGEALRWIIEPGSGQSAAINRGWQLASGEVLAWLNSDDLYTPGALRKVGEYFQLHPEVDIVYGECDMIDSRGGVLKAYPTRPFDFVELVRSTINYIPQPAAFMRRGVIENAGWLDERLSFVMDFDYWLRLGLQHKIEYFPEKLAALRLHATAKSVAQLGGFAVELVQMYRKFFSRDDLPSAILAVKREALANIYHRAADCAFWAGNLAAARDYLRRSYRYRSWPPRLLWFWVYSGRVGLFLAGRLFGNPYLPGKAES